MNAPATVRYRSTRDVPVRIWVSFAAPATGGAEAILPANEVVEVEVEPLQADWRFARPRRYAELETRLVPAVDRASARYGGYALVIACARLDADFEAVPGAPGEHPVSDILDHGRQIFSERIDQRVRQLAALIPRYLLWRIVDWRHAPGNDDLEALLRDRIASLTERMRGQRE